MAYEIKNPGQLPKDLKIAPGVAWPADSYLIDPRGGPIGGSLHNARQPHLYTKDEEALLALRDQPAHAARNFTINGDLYHCTQDDVHTALFGFAIQDAVSDNRIGRRHREGADKLTDPATAEAIFKLFQYNVVTGPHLPPLAIKDFAVLKMFLTPTVVEAIGGKERSKALLLGELTKMLEPFRGAAAVWRVPPEIEDSEQGIGIYARVRLLLAKEYEQLLAREIPSIY